ncbi:unnamed protein product [Macrosiphum euphorbiae]|uniref:Uncharacterized protein n=1 Tax=Macrosiphum euphorbiae TaxID=13131 RepID=A0AAV0XCS8_9HEMI|nr:unnamed protein product [Macrosiphum euphorbiae]
MPALFPRRLDVSELLTLMLGCDRTSASINESDSPSGTEDLPAEFRNEEIRWPKVRRGLQVTEQCNIAMKSAKLRLSDLLNDTLRQAAGQRSLNLVMPALFPRRIDVSELLTLMSGGERTATTLSESNSPAGTTGTEDVPQSRQSCVETGTADLQRTSTAICTAPTVESVLPELSPIRGRLQEYVQEQLIESSCVELETFVVEAMSADRPRRVRRCRSPISAVGRRLLKVSRRLCCWCGRK